ncbi:hypothetical protein [Streptomyces griseofuscus]|uniref:hypothetical protein n=1 Tax=Streptomyces griseofuscus TaxID=146922 RepID=UPI00345480FE
MVLRRLHAFTVHTSRYRTQGRAPVDTTGRGSGLRARRGCASGRRTASGSGGADPHPYRHGERARARAVQARSGAYIAHEEPYVAHIFANIIESGARSGGLAPGLAPERVGNLPRDVCFGALYRWSQPTQAGRASELDDELQAALKVLPDGIATVEHV